MVIEAGEQVQGFADRQLLREARLLQRDAQPLAQLALVALPRHAEDFDLARGRLQQAFENLDGGGLAGAVRSEQAEALAGLDGEIEPAHGFDLAVVGLRQAAASDGGFHTEE